ncbi:hypothetical protein [Amycolatopsis sp. NPDC004169]|uniref:hypothetical protein n=1 Tax=Amycolatopsis sp. NPDC004169 TaxID=3154453 RepID=UPI0033AF531F
MSDRNNRARKTNVAGRRAVTARPQHPHRRRRPRAVPAKPWSNVVDDCIRNDKVRRDMLIALAMVLIVVVVVACLVSGAVSPLIREAASNGVARTVAGSLFGGGLAYSGLRLYRRRTPRAAPATRKIEYSASPQQVRRR